VQRSKSVPLMSALGHKQTKRHHWAMSALPPKADIGWRRQRRQREVPLRYTASVLRLAIAAPVADPCGIVADPCGIVADPCGRR